jgi:hypothetical protein
MNDVSTHNRRSRFVAALATACLLTLVACGGGAASEGEATATASDASPAASEASSTAPDSGGGTLSAAVLECLAEQGFGGAFAGGGSPGERGSATPNAGANADRQAALQACADEAGIEIPVGGTDGFAGPGAGGFDPSELLACLATEGIEVDAEAAADSTAGPGGVVGSLDRDDPAVAAALAACGFGGPGRAGVP